MNSQAVISGAGQVYIGTDGKMQTSTSPSSCICCATCATDMSLCKQVYVTVPAFTYHSVKLDQDFTFSGRTYNFTIERSSATSTDWGYINPGPGNNSGPGNCASVSSRWTITSGGIGRGPIYCFFAEWDLTDTFDSCLIESGFDAGGPEYFSVFFAPVEVGDGEPIDGTYSVTATVSAADAESGDSYNGTVVEGTYTFPLPLMITIGEC